MRIGQVFVGRVLGLAMSLCATETFARGDCLTTAAKDFHLNETLLRAIAWHESGFRSNAVHVNNDGSVDVGYMQINSTHFKWLASRGIEKHRLFDTCTNIRVGAYLLADLVQQYGARWRAVGAYGAGTRLEKEGARRAYARKIQAAYAHVARAGVHE